MNRFWWCEAEAGRRTGPYSEAEIRDLIAAGTLGPPARIWSNRKEPWPPLDEPEPRRKWIWPPKAPSWSLLIAASLAVWLLFVVVLHILWIGQDEFVNRPDDVWIWPAAGLGLAASALAAGAAWWFLPRRFGAGPELTSALRISAVLSVLVCLVPAATDLRDAELVVRAALAVRDWTYEIGPGPIPDSVAVEGVIGPDFARDIQGRLDALKDPATVFIDSPGGLIGEALHAAEAIERKHASVVIGNQCVSACILVLMAGERRAAPYDGSVGFHAMSPVVSVNNAWADWEGRKLDGRVRAFLLRRGAPKADLEAADRLGPDKVFTVPALTALDQGVLTSLYDDGLQPITREEAVALLRRKGAPKPASPSAPPGSGASRTAPRPRP